MLYTPKIEKYSQAAVIEFYEERQGEDCYVETYGFKSYADLFYTRKPIPEDSLHHSLGWLMSDQNTKTTYFVCKVHKVEEFDKKFPPPIQIGEKNGFVFYKLEP